MVNRDNALELVVMREARTIAKLAMVDMGRLVLVPETSRPLTAGQIAVRFFPIVCASSSDCKGQSARRLV